MVVARTTGGRVVYPLSAYLHGPPYVVGHRAYLPYGAVGLVILDVAEPSSPRFVSRSDFGDLGSFLGCHSAVPIPHRSLVVANSEAIEEGGGDPLNYVFVIDIKDETVPRILSSFPLPRPSPGLPYLTYYKKGGRFGPHNQHHDQGHPDLAPIDTTVYLTYFNAGLRIFEISDPMQPEEVGYYVPSDPVQRRGPLPEPLVTQFEDTLVDRRGNIFCTDKNHGLFVLRQDLRGMTVSELPPLYWR